MQTLDQIMKLKTKYSLKKNIKIIIKSKIIKYGE